MLRTLRERSSRGCGYQSEPEGGSPVSDTHFRFVGKHLSPQLEVTFLRLFGEVGALGERLILIII